MNAFFANCRNVNANEDISGALCKAVGYLSNKFLTHSGILSASRMLKLYTINYCGKFITSMCKNGIQYLKFSKFPMITFFSFMQTIQLTNVKHNSAIDPSALWVSTPRNI